MHNEMYGVRLGVGGGLELAYHMSISSVSLLYFTSIVHRLHSGFRDDLFKSAHCNPFVCSGFSQRDEEGGAGRGGTLFNGPDCPASQMHSQEDQSTMGV